MRRLHHVNLGVPEDGLEAQAAFLIEVIGLRHMSPEDDGAPPTANWFEADDGVQVHLSRDPHHRPAERAHVAMDFGAGLAEVEKALIGRNDEYRVIDVEDGRRLFCSDPAGNRWELRGDG